MAKNINSIPSHVAIIPDGNRRWAKSHGLKPWEGHEAGAQNIEKLVEAAHNSGVRCLSIWGSSIDNLTKRPIREKKALLDIYKRYFKKLITEEKIHRNETKINVIGRWEEQFPESLKKVIREVMDKTKDYKKKMLNFMLAYGGTDDILQAIGKICAAGRINVTAELLKKNLMTAELPAVDFMIRTGGEPHNSNGFMMWDTADAQLYFFQGNFPDFTEKEFLSALKEYAQRGRRFGE